MRISYRKFELERDRQDIVVRDSHGNDVLRTRSWTEAIERIDAVLGSHADEDRRAAVA